MKMTTLKCALVLLLFSCQSDNDPGNPVTKICKHIEMSILDPDDPINLIIDFDDDGRVTSLRGRSDVGEEVNLVLQYDSDGLIENNLGEDYEIRMDNSTKEVMWFRYGDMTFGPAQLLTFNNHRLTTSLVLNEDNQGVETIGYTYDNDGNTTSVKATLLDENDDDMGTYFVEFTYDKTHSAVFANSPFLQAYTTFSSYLLPFGLTNKNLINHMTITFSYNDEVVVESRDVNYTFNADGLVTSLSWSNQGGEFETVFAYDCY